MAQSPPVQPLQVLREKAGLTQQDLAKQAGVYQSAVSRVENGTQPSLVNALKLCRALNTSVEEVFGHFVPPVRTTPAKRTKAA